MRHAVNGLGNVSGPVYNTLIPTTKGNRMLVEHNLKFVTEFQDGHPVTQQIIAMPEQQRILMLESMLKDLLVPVILPALDEINKGGTYAILKVAN